MKKLVMMAIAVTGISAHAAMMADFDSGEKPNNIGGDFGAWEKDPTDNTQFCREYFDDKATRQGTGYCLQLEYDVDSPSAAFNGLWMSLNGFDASDAIKLVFWAKADGEKGATPRFKVELKTEDEKGVYYVNGLTKEWTKFEIPLEDFIIGDLSALTELVFVFEDHTARPKEGILYIDDISIE